MCHSLHVTVNIVYKLRLWDGESRRGCIHQVYVPLQCNTSAKAWQGVTQQYRGKRSVSAISLWTDTTASARAYSIMSYIIPYMLGRKTCRWSVEPAHPKQTSQQCIASALKRQCTTRRSSWGLPSSSLTTKGSCIVLWGRIGKPVVSPLRPLLSDQQ